MCNTVTSWCWRGLLSFLILKLKLFNLYLYVWLDLLDLTLHFHKVDPPPMRLDPNPRSRFAQEILAGDLVHLESFQVLEVSWVFERQDYWEPRNCDGRFGVKWSRRGESVLRASPPREGHHSSENCGWCCTQGSHAPPSQSRGSDLHPPPHPALCSSQKFFVTTWTLLWVYVLHIIQNISTWVAITVAPPSCFFWFYMFIFMCVCVCTCVHYLERNIKSKKVSS